MTTSVVNCVLLVIKIKINHDDQPVHSKSLKPIQESTFVDLDNSFNDDGNFGSALTWLLFMNKRLLFHKGQMNPCVGVANFGKCRS
jgi:hypothetical protein